MSNKYSIRFLEENEYEKWDEFVENTKSGTIFNKSVWLKNIFEYKNVNFKILGCFDKNDLLIAGFAHGTLNKFNTIKIIYPPPLTHYNDIVFAEPNTKYRSRIESFYFTIINLFIDYLLAEYKLINLTFPPLFTELRPFKWRNFQCNIFYTYKADITNINCTYENLDSDIKRRIRKAEKLSYQILENNENENIEHFYSLQIKTFNRQNHSFQLTKSDFFSFINRIKKSNNIKIFSILFEKSPVASNIVVTHKGNSYYWLAGSDSKYLNTGLNQLLTWHTIQKLSSLGYTNFDFMGANTSSIASYKSSYNFELTPYYVVSIEKGQLIKSLLKLKSLIKI